MVYAWLLRNRPVTFPDGEKVKFVSDWNWFNHNAPSADHFKMFVTVDFNRTSSNDDLIDRFNKRSNTELIDVTFD